MLHERGIWVEIVTLVVPGFNDSDEELTRHRASSWRRCRPDIPWHVTAFHPDYKMTDPAGHAVATLAARRRDRGTAEGLRYVYAGNLPGQVGAWENTCCPGCHAVADRAARVQGDVEQDPGRMLSWLWQAIPGFWESDAAKLIVGS